MLVRSRNGRRLKQLADRCALRFQHAAVAEFEQAYALAGRPRDERSQRAPQPGEADAIGVLALAWRFAEQSGEGVAEAAVRFIAAFEDGRIDRASLADVTERALQPPGPGISLKGHPILLLKVPSHSGRIDAARRQVAVADALARR